MPKLLLHPTDSGGGPNPEPRRALGSRRELVEMVEQLASIARSGLPLPSGLRAAGLEMTSNRLRSTFLELADRLESGADLDRALGSIGRIPAHLRGLMLAGARSGRLADLLGEYVRGANLGSDLRRLFWSTLAYPTLALCTVLGLVFFVCSMSIQATEALVGTLADYGTQEPGSIRVLMMISRFVTDHGSSVLLGAAAVVVLTWAFFRLAMGAARRRRLLGSVPILGPILRFTSLTEFCHLLAMLVESDLPLPIAFELAGTSVGDADLAEACGRMGRAVASGEPLSTAVDRWEAIPAGLGQLFRWSEGRRDLPGALHLAGDMFESRARAQSRFAGNVLSTFLLLLTLWWIGFAIATLYLPLVSMISRLSG